MCVYWRHPSWETRVLFLSNLVSKHDHALTLVAVPDSVEVHVVLVVGEEEEAEPGVKGIDRNDEEDPHDVALFPGWAVKTKMHVDLEKTEETRLNTDRLLEAELTFYT